MRGGRALALLVPIGVLLGATPDARIWPWTPGAESFDLGTVPSAKACGECHEAEHTSWRASRHAASWTNDLMLVGYAAERLDFCVHCHAPSPEAAAEIRVNRDFYRSLDPRTGVTPGSVARQPEPRASDGIDCATCHVRGEDVLVAGTSYAPHPTRETPALTDGSFCLPCHDFGMPSTVDGHTTVTAQGMQTTGAEWRAWQASGGTETCQGCHMPGGDHRVRGASDRAFLRASVGVRAERTPSGARLTLESVGAGHHVPTGDLFRHITVEAARGDGPFEGVDRIGRTFERVPGPDGPRKVLADDTSLRPGVPRVVEVSASGPVRWRVVWHDGSPHDEARGLVPIEDIVVTLHEGAL